MIGFAVRRLAFVVPVLVGVSAVVFGLIQLAPGDAVDVLIGLNATAEARERLREALGLNDPVPLQYVRWLGLVVQGDWGQSIQNGQAVLPLIVDKFRISLILVAGAIALAVPVGMGLGLIAAVRHNSKLDRIIRAVCAFALSMPSYWLGILAILVFAQSLSWFPTGGMGSHVARGGVADLAWHLVLPATVAAAQPAALIARVARASILEVIRLDFVTTLRAAGLRESAVIRHVVRNALPAIVTVAGLQLGYLFLGSTLFVEVIFAWPGMGLQMYQSVTGRDSSVVMGLVLFGATVFVLVNLAVDLTHRLIDPRVQA